MGLVLLVVIWLITLISSYFFFAKTWWFPVGASAAAAGIDHYFMVTLVLMGIVFVAAQGALGYLAWKYRDRDAPPSHVIRMATIAWKSPGRCLLSFCLWD